MDKEIKELMEYIESSSFVEFELEREGFKLKLVRRSNPENGPAVLEADHVPATPTTIPLSTEAAVRPAASEPLDIHLLKSPIVGTFYRASAPAAKPFTEPGDKIKKGQILCIVEAMKLMNEIESDCDGEVLEILVANGQPVEFGEALFKIRTSLAA